MMINGFVIDVKNETEVEHEIPLFMNIDLPAGLSVSALNSEYNYDSLLLMAKTKFFMGTGFNSSIIKKIKIFNRGNVTDVNLDEKNPAERIIIDGIDNYITIIVPPLSAGVFQLLTGDQ